MRENRGLKLEDTISDDTFLVGSSIAWESDGVIYLFFSGETRMRIGLPIFFLKRSKASLILSKEVFSLTAAEMSSRPCQIKLTIWPDK